MTSKVRSQIKMVYPILKQIPIKYHLSMKFQFQTFFLVLKQVVSRQIRPNKNGPNFLAYFYTKNTAFKSKNGSFSIRY